VAGAKSGKDLRMEVIGGRYRIVERLGAGGMAVVWRAFDEVLGRQVAIKVLARNLAGDPDFARQIRLEARAAARLAHPNIGVVYDYGECADTDGHPIPFIVMELIDGPSLSEIVTPGGLPWRQAVAICGEIAAALAAAHARGLVHRDVKPANVMLPAAGVKVVDFGISALVGEEADAAPDGKLLGTPAYVAPERLIGAPVGPASDVYALGVLLHVALTGRLPWQVDGSRLLRAHLELAPDALPLVDGMPGEIAELYQDCLAKDPAERPAAEQVAARLTAVAGASVPQLNVLAAPASVIAAQASVSPAPSGWPGTDSSQPTAFLPLIVGDTMPVAATTASNSRSGPAGVRRWLAGAGTTPRRTGGIVLILLALLATGAALATDGRGEGSTGILAASAPHACRITYQIRDDTAGKFSGTVTVSNMGPRTLNAWTVSFNMPGDQQLDPGDPPVWGQTGQAITLRPGAGVALPDHQEATFPFAGTHGATNPLPVAFALNDAPCEVQLLGPSGVPTTAAQAGTVSTAPSVSPSPTKSTKHGKGNGNGDGGDGDH
jgi:hypothetical protein